MTPAARRGAALATALLLAWATAAGAAPCAAPHGASAAPAWRAFACRFMTVDRWQAAGRPLFTAPDGSRWQPWFYGDRGADGNNLVYEGRPYRPRHAGLLEALLKTGVLPDEYDPAYVPHYWDLFRYTPWSVYVLDKAGCRNGRTADLRRLVAAGRVPRSRLLGLDWDGLAHDPADPTSALGRGAMGALMKAAGAGGAPPAGPGAGLCRVPRGVAP